MKTRKKEFVGYDTLETQVKITKYRRVETQKEGELYQLVFNLTPFYPGRGGQVGDKGYLEASNGEVYIIDTKRKTTLLFILPKTFPAIPSKLFRLWW